MNIGMAIGMGNFYLVAPLLNMIDNATSHLSPTKDSTRIKDALSGACALCTSIGEIIGPLSSGFLNFYFGYT